MAATAPGPARAPVPPRIVVAGGSVPRLLEQEVAELLATGQRASVHLVGPPGSGLTTALRHLAAAFAGDTRLGLVDTDGSGCRDALVTVTATAQPPRDALAWTLWPWTDDDVLDYLVHRDRATAGAAFARWRAEPDARELAQLPALCRAVLDTMAAHRRGPTAALRAVLDVRLSGPERSHARSVALAAESRSRADAPPAVPLLGPPFVRAVLAAEAMLDTLQRRTVLCLPQRTWSAALLAALRRVLDDSPGVEARLLEFVRGGSPVDDLDQHHVRAGALSVLCAVHAGFRPPTAELFAVPSMRLAGADLRSVRIRGFLDHADLTGADLRCADLHGTLARHARFDGACCDAADLDQLQARAASGAGLRATRASLRGADLCGADLRSAVLDGALLVAAQLGGADLSSASLREADLRGASLAGARLDGADLSGASCQEAKFGGCDLRTTRLAGASFAGADCARADLTGQELPGLVATGASFRGAWLTGTRWPNAMLQGSTFAEAGLAAVDWQGADLRHCDFDRAAFHLGSSRSGLVPGGVPGEGSRTGFYSDEALEAAFQAPEDVRKANLRDCDLRAARLGSCDFYLVDLRGARLDDEQRAWLQRCRAILDP